MNPVFRHIAFFLTFVMMLLVPAWASAQDTTNMADESQAAAEEGFDAKSFIFGHTGDA